jgi:hypothetical protein
MIGGPNQEPAGHLPHWQKYSRFQPQKPVQTRVARDEVTASKNKEQELSEQRIMCVKPSQPRKR